MATRTQLDPRNYEKLPANSNAARGIHLFAQKMMDLEKAFICECCGKHVQQVSIEYGHNIDGYKVKVFCHGETDECFLDRELIRFLTSDPNAQMEKIRCFQKNKLGELPKQIEGPPKSD